MQPTLKTERLVLRPYRLDDAADVQRLAGDERVAAATTMIPHPYPDEAAESWISTHQESFVARKEITYAVTLIESGELVGTISLLDISEKNARGELGYWVGVEYWGRGYCTEAALRLIRFANEHLGMTKIVARCVAWNAASARVMEKAGLTKEGHLSKHVFKEGRYDDVLLYGLVLNDRGG